MSSSELEISNTNHSPLLVIGHRGAMGYHTENTLGSIQKALDLHVDMIELDVYRILTGELVVFHDDDLMRLAGVDRKIEELTIEELSTMELIGGGRIPLLHEVIDLVSKKARLNIELKGRNTAAPVFNLLKEYIENEKNEDSDFLISSFRWDELQKMRILHPKIPIGILSANDPLDMLEIAKRLRAVSIHPYFELLDEETMLALKEERYQIYTWTVNEIEDINRMIAFGVNGIISNYPDRIKNTLN